LPKAISANVLYLDGWLTLKVYHHHSWSTRMMTFSSLEDRKSKCSTNTKDKNPFVIYFGANLMQLADIIRAYSVQT